MNEAEMSQGTNVLEPQQGIPSNRDLLPLDLPERVVALRMREGGSTRRHFFRRIERPDVDAYFAATLIATQRQGQVSEDEIDIGTAELKLYGRAIVRVEGYKLNDGRDLMELPNWKERVPGGHRIRAVDLIMKVTRSVAAGEQLLDPECDVVSIDACWTEKEGTMSWYRGLLHRFTPPTMTHWQKFNNFRTKSTRGLAVGGSQVQRTIYPKLDGILGNLYDDLIVGVEGYSFGGAALTDRATVIAQMDKFHKIIAVSSLFDKSESDELAEETETK